MSSDALPPKPAGTIRTRRMAHGADPDAPPRVTEALAPPPAASTPPSPAPTPSAATKPLKPSEVRVRGRTPRMAQGADPSPHPRVTKALAPPPSADPTPSAATTPSASRPLLEPSEVRVRSPTRRAAQGSDTDPHLLVAEAPALLPAAARLLSEAASPNSHLKVRFVLRGDQEQGSDPDARSHVGETPATLPSSSTLPPKPMRYTQRGAPARAQDPSSSSAIQTRSRARLAAQANPAKSVMVVRDTSTKENMPIENLSLMSNGKNYLMLGKCNVGQNKNYKVSQNVQLILSNLSEKVDEATANFRLTMKECSSDKSWQHQVDEASLNFAARLKEIQNEQLRCLVAQLSKEVGSKKLALVYDERMLLHIPQNPDFDEKPERLTSIMDYLKKQNIIDRCDIFNCDEATLEQLLSVHKHSDIKDIESTFNKDQRERDSMALKHSRLGDIYYSKGSGQAARLAAGGAIKACSLVAEKMYQHSFAIIRPPGHHAGPEGPSGFCLFGNAAIGAAHLLKHYKMKKVLVIDWDVHHGNGTQEVFYGDEHVLFFSVHRYGNGFYPNTGSSGEIGEGSGTGFNVNFGWTHDKIRDVDYLAVWEHVLLPLIEEFQPEIILISAGFDAAEGDKLGRCCVTPGGFASMLQALTKFAPIVMILEGGYCLEAMPKCAEACIKVLLGDNSVITHDTESLPYDTTWETIFEIRELLKPFWRIFASEISKDVYSKRIPYIKKGSRCTDRSKKKG